MAQLIKGVVDTQIENLRPIGSTNAGDDTVIELSIKSNGQDFIFNNPTFEVLSKKEDNTKTRQIKDITLLDGKVKIKADIQLTLCKGIVTNQLIINDGDKISTVYFYFMVNPSLENEVLEESKDKIESLDKLDKLINTSFSDLEAYENKLLAFSAEMDSIVEVESKREANELIRSTSEVKRIYNEDSRIISEEDRIANEAIRVENEEARGLAESERVTNENNRRLAENTRKTQENARVAAEEQRQSIFEENENIRKEQEGKRVQAESVRKNKFNTWEEREGLRLISEDQRREAEESRQLAESNRDKAEKVREQQEANREATYNNFNNAEEERVNNESSRKDKENLRALAENSRVAAEKERVAAENTRNSRYETAESNRNNTFNSNENKRQSDYESNEGTRNSTFEAEERKRKNSYQDAENTRNNSFNQQEENRQNAYTAAERLRVENENLRKNNEATRGSNEETRKTNETSRVSAENIRVENEKTRVAAEEERQANFEKIKTDNTTFKEEVKAQYEDIASEFDKAVANVTNGNENVTNSEIVQARGKEVNLNARLTKFDSQLDKNKNELTIKINEVATTGTTIEAVQNKVSEMAQNGTITFNTVTPDMTTFFNKVIDNSINIFDGKYQKYYMSGSNGSLVLKSNEKGKCAILKINKNTTYSITTNIAVLMKIATSTTLISSGTFDGAINVTQGTTNQALRTTGETDEYMYISLTNPTTDNYTDEEVYLKVVESDSIKLPSENEKYPVSYIPHGIDVPSNREVENIVEKKINIVLNENTLEVTLTSGAKITMNQTTDNAKNLNVFRITKVEKGSYIFGENVDYDGVIKIKDNSDYSGGYHGQEQEINKFFLADGKRVTSFTGECKKFTIIVESHIYTNDGNATNVFDKCKTITFEKDNYIIENVYTCLSPCIIDHARTTLFSINTTGVIDGFTYGDVIGTNSTFDNTSTGTLFFKKDVNKIVTVFGDTEVICELLPNSTKKSCHGLVAGFTNRIKPYIDNIKYNLDVVASDVIRSTSKYTIH